MGVIGEASHREFVPQRNNYGGEVVFLLAEYDGNKDESTQCMLHDGCHLFGWTKVM